MFTAPHQGDNIKGDDLGSAFGICATERYRVLCGNMKEWDKLGDQDVGESIN